MNPERWQRIRELLEAALERPPNERAVFLDQACGSDPELRKEVESLIDYQDEAESFLESPPESSGPLVGRTISHYEVREEIGRGGMGEVYVAEDTKLHRNVALKILPREMDSEERRHRFEREAQAIAALNHPNIVHVYSVEKSDGVHFITMELVHGKTLSELIPKSGMSLEKFFEIAIPITDAVSAAHEQRVIHRDLKPDNLMVSDEGRLKILDFGLAKLKQEFAESGISELPTQSATGEGRILGTVAYMSPEQAEGKKVDHRSDIFSIGIILYEMVTGRRPFQGDTTASLLSSIIKDTPAPVMEVKPSLPHNLGRIINRCLVKDPEHRYQTAKDVRNELEDLKDEATVTPAPSIARKWFLSATFVAVSALSLIAYMLTREAPGPQPIQGTLARLTSQEGYELFPSLSPDGETIIYHSDTPPGGNFDIYRRRVGGRTSFNLTKDSTDDDWKASFSPDGQRIAFRSERDGGGIFIMGATGESVRRLTDFGDNPAWSPDGKRIVFSTEGVTGLARGPNFGQLRTVHLDTGEIRAIETNRDAVQPRWSPHGHRIAFCSIPFSGNTYRDIWTIPAEGGEPIPVTQDEYVDLNPVWSPDGKHIYFSSERGGTRSLWRVAVEEETGTVLGPPESVTTSVTARIGGITISGDGRRIAYSADVSTQNVKMISFDADAEAVVGEPVWITRGSRRTSQNDPSPDGEWMAFNLLPGGGQADVAIIRTDGTDLRELTDAPQHSNRMPRWSPDGSRIAFYSQRSGSFEIWTIRPDGSGLKQLTETPYDIIHFAWSPDGSQMAYFAAYDDGEFDTYIFSPGSPWEEQTPHKLPPHSGEGRLIVHSWSPDGKWLAGYIADESNQRIALFSLVSQEYEILPVEGREPVWLSDNQRLIYEYLGMLYMLDRESGNTHEVLSAYPGYAHSPRLSRDDRWIYYQNMVADSDIWLLTLDEDQ